MFAIFRGISSSVVLVLCVTLFLVGHFSLTRPIELEDVLGSARVQDLEGTKTYVVTTTVRDAPTQCPTPQLVTSCSVPAPTKLSSGNASSHAQQADDTDATPNPERDAVRQLRDMGVVVVFKTGAQEVPQTAMQLNTLLRYFEEPDILFFSDWEGSIGRFPVRDALRNVDLDLRLHHADFEIYRRLKQFESTGQDILELKEPKADKEARIGWKLDKYKFIHLTEQAYVERPRAKWYFFIETDTYVIWSNVVQWLRNYDSTKPWYIGSVVMYGDTAFAHGGSAYVLSRPAMDKLFGPDQPQGLAASWDERMEHECCGDVALGKALKEHGVEPIGAGRFLSGEKPATYPYGPRDHWCQPVGSMHHMQTMEGSSMWRFERRRESTSKKPNNTLIFSELYHKFVKQHLNESREDWDNDSSTNTYTIKDLKAPTMGGEEDDEEEAASFEAEKDHEAPLADKDADGKDQQFPSRREAEHDESESESDTDKRTGEQPPEPRTRLEKQAHRSFEACRAVCAAQERCMQFRYYDGVCRTADWIRLGWYQAPTKRNDDGLGDRTVSLRSGWMMDRIRAFTENNPCTAVDWD